MRELINFSLVIFSLIYLFVKRRTFQEYKPVAIFSTDWGFSVVVERVVKWSCYMYYITCIFAFYVQYISRENCCTCINTESGVSKYWLSTNIHINFPLYWNGMEWDIQTKRRNNLTCLTFCVVDIYRKVVSYFYI